MPKDDFDTPDHLQAGDRSLKLVYLGNNSAVVANNPLTSGSEKITLILYGIWVTLGIGLVATAIAQPNISPELSISMIAWLATTLLAYAFCAVSSRCLATYRQHSILHLNSPTQSKALPLHRHPIVSSGVVDIKTTASTNGIVSWIRASFTPSKDPSTPSH